METISNNKLLFTIIIILILINISTLSLVWYGRLKEPPFPPPPPMMESPRDGPPPEGRAFLKEQLKLTDVQMETIDKIRESHISQIRKIKEDMKGLKDKLFSDLKNPDADTNTIKDITNQIGNIEARVDIITFDNFREVRKICSDEQKKKFDEIILDVLKMGAPDGRPDGRRGPPGMRENGPPPPVRDGDGHRNPPNQEGPPEKK